MTKQQLLSLLETIGHTVPDKTKLFQGFEDLLLAFIEEPMTTSELAVIFQTKTDYQLLKRPMPTGLRPSAAEAIEIANLHTVRGGGFLPLLILSHGFYHNQATTFYIRGYDRENTFSAEWLGRAESARVSYSGTPKHLSDLFTVEHEATNP